MGSTSEVPFHTVRLCEGTTKSHISHVVLDAPRWEHSVAHQPEKMREVSAYPRDDHLGFTIPYEWQGGRHGYQPDYLVDLSSADGKKRINLILESKGFESQQGRQKDSAGQRWDRAINHRGEFGGWEFVVSTGLPERLRTLSASAR